MKRAYPLLLSVILIVTLLPVSALAQEPTSDFEVVRAAADAYLSSNKPPTIRADDLFELLNDGDPLTDPFVLSVRKPEDYAKGHIPGAINIFYKDLTKPENLAKLPTDRQIVVYCYTGHTGQIASTILNLLGYDAVNLRFGMMGWTKDDNVLAITRFGPTAEQRDYRVETTPNEATETYTYPTLRVGGDTNFEIIHRAADQWLQNAATPIVSVDPVWENLSDGDVENDPLIVSVRDAQHYALGHVPGAINIPWQQIAKPDNLSKLPPDERFLVYCYTGHTGMVAGTILGMLGYDAGNIKFGMMAWIKDDNVLAVPRFNPTTQPDYRVETSAAETAAPAETTSSEAPAPATLPVSGASPAGLALYLLAGGASLLGGGILLRRR